MDYQTIETTLAGGVATIALARPEVMNALNGQMRAELRHALGALDPKARVVVLTGRGRAFCSGQDLGDAGTMADVNLTQLLRDEYAPLVRAITDCPVPVLAAVNGVAAGAGANLALAADVVIAAESAAFIQAFSRIGLMPDAGGTWILPRLVGHARAVGAALFAERVSARQAADWGMIWEAVPDDLFAEHWQARAAHLAAGPSLAYRAIRETLRESWSHDLGAQLDLEARHQGDCGASRDFREGVVAFQAKRPPGFEGR